MMPLDISPIFSVPLAQDLLKDHLALNTRLRPLILAREAEGERYSNPNPALRQQAGVFESNFDFFSEPDPCIQQLRSHVWAALGRVIRDMNGYEAETLRRLQIFSDSWFHVTRHGGFTILHSHAMASWSGVYCVDPGETVEDRPESGVLRFHNPHFYSNMFMDEGNRRFRPPYHHGTWSLKLQAGHLILFPSWLLHEVMPFYGKDERITVAFNCWFGIKGAKDDIRIK